MPKREHDLLGSEAADNFVGGEVREVPATVIVQSSRDMPLRFQLDGSAEKAKIVETVEMEQGARSKGRLNSKVKMLKA